MKSGHDRTVGWAVTLLIGVMAISGCGDAGKKPVAKVSGKVTFNGQAVTGGTIMLAPVKASNSPDAGTPARCSVQSDGSFKASRTLGLVTMGESTGCDERRTWQLDVPERISGP